MASTSSVCLLSLLHALGGHTQLRQHSEAVAQLRYVQLRGALRTGDRSHCSYDRCIELRLGSSVHGHTDIRSVVARQMAHKPLGIKGKLEATFSLKMSCEYSPCSYFFLLFSI